MTLDTLAAFSALIISIGTFAINLRWHNKQREKHELREHFDKDIRDLAHYCLNELREYRRRISVSLNELHQDAHSFTTVYNYIEGSRHSELTPAIQDIRATLDRATQEYGELLGYAPMASENETVALQFLLRCEDEYDRLMVSISDLLFSLKSDGGDWTAEGASVDNAFYEYDKLVRTYLNELRTKIVTGKRRQSLFN